MFDKIVDIFLRESDVLHLLKFDDCVASVGGGSTMKYKYLRKVLPATAQFRKLGGSYTSSAATKQEYDRIADALASCKSTGYGIVMPDADAMTLETPEILKKGGAFGVKLKAGAPSIHMIRVDVDTQISPMVGSEEQSRELISYLCSQEPDALWQSNIFGKSVYEMIRESLTGKLVRTSDDVREKFRGTLGRIVNDGATGLICLIL